MILKDTLTSFASPAYESIGVHRSESRPSRKQCESIGDTEHDENAFYTPNQALFNGLRV